MRFTMFAPFATLALAALCTLAAPAAQAQLVFSFSVTNTIGNVPGTFTGEIFGLTDNTTSAATSVVIETFPAGLNSLVSPPIDATTWDQQFQNSFTVSGGQITAGGFWAQQTINGFSQGYQLYLNGDGGPFNFLNLDGTDDHYVWGDNGFAAANFAPVAAVPEPGSVALLVGMGTMGATFLRRRKNARLAA